MSENGEVDDDRDLDLELAEAEKLSEWAENLDGLPASARVVASQGPEAGREFLEKMIGKEEVDRIAGRGRPALGRAGVSPTRTLRLPRELDDALVARAAAEHRRPSEVMRDALSTYLRAS